MTSKDRDLTQTEIKKVLDDTKVKDIVKDVVNKKSDIKSNTDEKPKLSTYEVLSKVKCKIEKKGRFNYVSWADAWDEVLKHYPDSKYKVFERETIKDGILYNTGLPLFKINDTAGAFVKVGVTIDGIERIEHFPITDNYNKALPYDRIDVFTINTAIKRALVKAVSLFGLGLYVYRGEDLPEDK